MRNSWSCSSQITDLPPLSALQTWVHRPQAIARCLISDVYALRALVEDNAGVLFGKREIFLLNQFPCRMVEVVGWVAGVDDKESSLIVTVDDGDGECVLPVTVKLPKRSAPIPPKSRSPPNSPVKSGLRTTFLSAAERKAERKAALQVEKEAHEAQIAAKHAPKIYERKDIRVGDTVKIVGRVEEWSRRKHDGLEWVRGVCVEEAGGGSIEVVQPEEQYSHLAEVIRLHETVYSRPFEIPPLPSSMRTDSAIQNGSLPTSPEKSLGGYTFSDGTTLDSTMVSEISMQGDDCLPDIRKLRSSQLNEHTFRRYLLDHMTEEVRIACMNLELSGIKILEESLGQLFPEYQSSIKGKEKATESSRVLTPSTSWNSIDMTSNSDDTPKVFKKRRKPSMNQDSYGGENMAIPSFTVSQLLETPHLDELASMTVEAEHKKEERRRRRRIRDGEATQKDKMLEDQRMSSQSKSWKLTHKEKISGMRRLVERSLRTIAEEGSLVHLSTLSTIIIPDSYQSYQSNSSSSTSTSTAYIPLPPPLLLPLVLYHLEEEKQYRSRIFIKKTDARYKSGATAEEIANRMRSWGEEGRWERIGVFRVEEAIHWGRVKGLIRSEGKGSWVA